MPKLPADPTFESKVAVAAGRDDTDDMRRFMDWFWTSDEMSRDWRAEAKRCRRFVDGHQWEQKDRDALHDKGKPALTFNRIGPVVDAVIGLEIATRQETAVKPRGVEDAPPSEVFSGLVKWMRDMARAQDAETEAFRDMIITGVGCTDTQAESTMVAEGQEILRKTTKTRMDPEYVWFDHAAGERNMVNGRYVFVFKDVSLEHARSLLPPPKGEEWDASDYDAAWARTTKLQWEQRTQTGFASNASAEQDKRKGLVTLGEVQWYEYADDGSRQEMRANIGGRVLRQGPNPVQGKGFSIQFLTGKRDPEIHAWYGIVRAMIEPQGYANKFMSQYLHIVNTSANGGLILEETSVDNLELFNKNFSKPDMNVVVADGSVSGRRIMEKPQTGIPAGLRDLLQLAMDAPYTVTGINPEMLGMVSREQAGVLEESRKQAAVGILAWLIESGRQHRQESGSYLLGVVKAMVPPELALRVLGEAAAEAIMAAYAPGVDEYDIVVDESPQSPNQKERTWAMLQPMLKYILEKGDPTIIIETLRYSPFPSSLVSAWEKSVSQAQQDPAQQQQQQQAQMQMMQASLDKMVAEIDNLKANAELTRAKAGVAQIEGQIKPMEAAARMQPQPQAAPPTPEFQPFAMEQAAADVDETRARAAKMQADAAAVPLKLAIDANRQQQMANRGATDGR